MSCQQLLNSERNDRCRKTDSLENALSEPDISTSKNTNQETSVSSEAIDTEIDELLQSPDVMQLKVAFFECLAKKENVKESIKIQELLRRPDVIRIMELCPDYSTNNEEVNNSKLKNILSLLGDIGFMLFMDRPIEMISCTLIALFKVLAWTVTCSTNAMCFIHRNLLYFLHPYPEELLVFAIDSFTNMALSYPNEMEVEPPIRELQGEVNGTQEPPLTPSRSPSRKEASCIDINLQENVNESPGGSAIRTPRSNSPVTEEPIPEDKPVTEEPIPEDKPVTEEPIPEYKPDPSKPRREENLQACTLCTTTQCTKSKSLLVDCSFCQAFKRTLAQKDDDEDGCNPSSLKEDIHQTSVKVMRTLYAGSGKP